MPWVLTTAYALKWENSEVYKNNSIQFFIIYMPSQQLQGQLQTQHNIGTDNQIVDKHNIKSKTNHSKHWRKKHINTEK
jgi:hypothetical protein